MSFHREKKKQVDVHDPPRRKLGSANGAAV